MYLPRSVDVGQMQDVIILAVSAEVLLLLTLHSYFLITYLDFANTALQIVFTVYHSLGNSS